jgi:23S rRNA (uracil1939-C5)-methyltransferase
MNKRRQRKRKLPSQPIELDILRLSHDGRGVASIDGKVAFVAGSLPGERVSAKYVRKRSQLDELRTETVLESAESRVVPDCEFASLCGGCTLQHMQAEAQIAFKKSVLFEKLEHATSLPEHEIESLPNLCAKSYHYRNKARLAVRYVAKKGGTLVGFREKHSSFIVDMNNCSVLVQEVADLINPLRDLINALRCRDLIPQIEVAVGERDVGKQVALVIRHLLPLNDEDLAALQNFAKQYVCEIYLQSGGVDTVSKCWPEDGIERLHYRLDDYGLTMAFHPMDFTQVNSEINQKMIPLAIQLMELKAQDTVLDLYSGLGNFTLPMATQCKQVVGVEGSQAMVDRGQENAVANGIENASFYAADLMKPITGEPWADQHFDKVLLDPPRSGAIEIIDHIARLGAQKIVYVSCNPSTLARDAAQLIAQGYSLVSAGVMDMFPHTAHVESIALFERIK